MVRRHSLQTETALLRGATVVMVDLSRGKQSKRHSTADTLFLPRELEPFLLAFPFSFHVGGIHPPRFEVGHFGLFRLAVFVRQVVRLQRKHEFASLLVDTLLGTIEKQR